MPSKIDTPTLLKLHAKMIKCAQSHRHPYPDDMAQEYVCRLLEGRHAHATVDQAYIDIIRMTTGNSRMPGYEAKRQAQGLATVDQMKILDYIVDDRNELTQDETIDLKRLMGRIENPRMQVIFEMRLEGFTMQEIAKDLGVTQAYIHQLIDKEIERIAPVSGEF